MPSGLAALLDDIATIAKVAAASVDDVAAAAGKAGSKAAGVVIDDTAVTPQYVTGFTPDRELPIIWRIAKGSFFNKLVIILPVALLLSLFLPWAITPILMLGGAYLCFEGAEKVWEKIAPHEEENLLEELAELTSTEHEAAMVKGAVRTDFILSAEIIVITLGAVAEKTQWVQVGVLAAIALLMTVGVYGLVGGIVKLDDAGLHLIRNPAAGLWSRGKLALGRFLLWLAPKLMKFLSVAGTAAMFLVGGGILTHNVPVLHHAVEGIAAILPSLSWLVMPMVNALFGVLLGLAVVALVTLYGKMRYMVRKGPTAT